MSVENGDNMKKQCLRCGDKKNTSEIGVVLFNFVCDGCRQGEEHWDFNERRNYATSITTGAMEKEMIVNDILFDPEDDQIETESRLPANMRFGKIELEPVDSRLYQDHRNHPILGAYCWDCKKHIGKYIPGWSHENKNIQYYRISWADGSKDDSDKCDECLRHDCKRPVHRDYYKEKAKRVI